MSGEIKKEQGDTVNGKDEKIVGGGISISDRISIWEKIVDVQQHFNDIELRIRNFAITLVAAILSLAAVSIKDYLTVILFGRNVPVSAILALVAFFIWLAFYLMDRHWYHRLLYGAVKHGERIEKQLANILPEIQLTKTISETSPLIICNKKLRSTTKMDIFYSFIGLGLLILTIIFYLGLNQATSNNKSFTFDEKQLMGLHKSLDDIKNKLDQSPKETLPSNTSGKKTGNLPRVHISPPSPNP